jgi:hypothetical protein
MLTDGAHPDRLRASQLGSLRRILETVDSSDPRQPNAQRARALVDVLVFHTWATELRALTTACPSAAEAHANPSLVVEAAKRVEAAMDKKDQRGAEDVESHVRAALVSLGCAKKVAKNLFNFDDKNVARKSQ